MSAHDSFHTRSRLVPQLRILMRNTLFRWRVWLTKSGGWWRRHRRYHVSTRSITGPSLEYPHGSSGHVVRSDLWGLCGATQRLALDAMDLYLCDPGGMDPQFLHFGNLQEDHTGPSG